MPKRSRSGRGSEGGAASRRRSSDAGASQGGGAQASAQAQLQDLSPEIEERLVRSAFRVVMYKHAKKEPATKTDIRDAIGKDYKAAVLEHVIRQAQSLFEALCGFKMVEVQARSSKAYLLQASDELLQQVSASDTTALAPAPGCDAALAGLLSAVVGSIVLAKGEIKKEEFWALMKELGLLENDRDHPKLGNVKEAFVSRRHRFAASRALTLAAAAAQAKLKRQQYIDESSTKTQARQVVVHYRLGVRSKEELIRPKMRELLNSTFEDTLDEDEFEGLCAVVWPEADDDDEM